MTRPRNHAAIGRAAQQRGDAFEAWLDAAHEAHVATGVLARMRHVGPPHKRIGGGEVVIIGDGPADYQGQTTRAHGGRAVAIEAKCRAGNLRLAELPAHQVADLDACADGGGVAALVYRWTTPDRRAQRTFVVPWRRVPWAAARRGDGPSVGPEACAPWEVDPRALLDPRDALWRPYLAPLLAAQPPVVRLPWTPGLDGVLLRAFEALRAGRGRTVEIEAYGVRLEIGGDGR